MTYMDNIFDLEQKIMDCWGIVDDIETLYAQLLDGETKPTTDEIANVLLGIKQLYQYKFSQTFDKFEDICKDIQNMRNQQRESLDSLYKQNEKEREQELKDPTGFYKDSYRWGGATMDGEQ